MKFFATICAFGAAASAAASSVSVSYDTVYDNAAGSMSTVACSDGSNGLITKYGYKTFDAVPGYPNIGGSSTIPSWNAATCGQCFKVTYKDKSIFVTALDTSPTGLNLSKAAMNKLTNNQATQLGRVTANMKKVDVSKCGLRPANRRSIEWEG